MTYQRMIICDRMQRDKWLFRIHKKQSKQKTAPPGRFFLLNRFVTVLAICCCTWCMIHRIVTMCFFFIIRFFFSLQIFYYKFHFIISEIFLCKHIYIIHQFLRGSFICPPNRSLFFYLWNIFSVVLISLMYVLCYIIFYQAV